MEQRASYSPELQATEEAYYAEFWARDEWGKREPSNVDERNRAEAIASIVRRRVLPALKSRTAVDILDVGCGRGWLTNILREFGLATGVDPVAAAVHRARELFPDLAFRVGYSDDLLAERGPEQFDVIVASEVIEHIPAAAKGTFLRSLHGLLRPAGFLVLTTPRGELFGYWRNTLKWGSQPVEEWLTESELDALSRSSGFSVLEHSRIWIPKVRYSVGARIASSRPVQRAARFAPGMVRPMQNRFGFYQLLLAQPH